MKRRRLLCIVLALLLAMWMAIPASAWHQVIDPPAVKTGFTTTLYDGGGTTTFDDYAGRTLLIIHGNRDCTNCHSAYDSLKPYMPAFKAAGVSVLVNLNYLEAADPVFDAMRRQKQWDPGLIFTYGRNPMSVADRTAAGIPSTYFTPAIILVDPAGYIRYASTGYLENADMKSLITAIEGAASASLAPTIKVPQTKLSLAKGKKYTVKLTVTPDIFKHQIRAKSSNPSVLEVDDYPLNPVLIAKKPGTATVTVYMDASTAQANIDVTVTGPPTPLKNFKLDRSSATVHIDAPLQLRVAKLNPSGATVNLASAKWKSSNSSIASVSSDGLVTARKKGKVTITCTLNNKKATCTIKTRVPLTDFSLSKSELTLQAGKSATLKPGKYTPSGTTSTKKAKWQSSDASVASVNAKGIVKAKASGTATITCTIDGITAECIITIA